MVERIPMRKTGPASPFKIIIDEQSRLKNEERKKERTSLYASDYGQCQRKVWYQFHPLEFPPETGVDARLARIFANGEDVHIRLQGYLSADETLQFRDEVQVPRDELDVHGRCDGLAMLQGQLYVLEFKSIYLQKVEEPKDEHVGQVMWYMHMFEKQRKALRAEFGLEPSDVVADEWIQNMIGCAPACRKFEDLDETERKLLLSPGEVRGEIIYESKSSQETFHFQVAYDEARAEKVELWFKQVKESLAHKEPPEVHYDGKKFPCKWRSGQCAYYGYCWGGLKAAKSDGNDVL